MSLRSLAAASRTLRPASRRSFATSSSVYLDHRLDPSPSSTSAASSQHTAPADVVAQLKTGGHIDSVPVDDVVHEVTSGAPNELLHRAVRIYKPTKTTMQSAKGKTKRWTLDWDVLQGAGRWENPLMGWASSADYMQGTQLFFPSKEAAVAFAEKQGWEYLVQDPKPARIPPKNYASNYVHVPGKLRIHHTK